MLRPEAAAVLEVVPGSVCDSMGTLLRLWLVSITSECLVPSTDAEGCLPLTLQAARCLLGTCKRASFQTKDLPNSA